MMIEMRQEVHSSVQIVDGPGNIFFGSEAFTANLLNQKQFRIISK
jgi:hypothetical protein